MRKKNKITFVFALCLIFSMQINAQEVIYQFTKHYDDRYAYFHFANDVDSTKIVMLGNSLTENAGDWNSWLLTDNVVNRGISGDDAKGMLYRLDQILPKRPRAIFLMCGINDLSHDLSPEIGRAHV